MKVSSYAKIALFFIVLGVAGGFYVIKSSDGFNTLNTRIYRVSLADATGLTNNSRVYLAGVPVGKIQTIQLSGYEAELTVGLLKDLEVHSDAQIARRSSSILGTSMLALDPGTELAPLIPEGGRISAEQGMGDMSAVIGVVQELGGQIGGILTEFQANQMQLLAVSLETFNSIARKIDNQAEAELDRVSRILEAAALITERTERLLARSEGDISLSFSEIRGALENIRSVTGEIRSGQGNIGRAIYDDRLYASLLATVEKTEIAAEKLQATLDSINTLAVDANGVVHSAGEIVEKAVGLGIQVDTRAAYEMLSNRVRAGASIRLNPRSNDRWYRIGVNGAPDGISSRTVTTSASGAPGTVPVTTVTDKTETRYSFSVDAELARKFGILTIRGGLLESTAGLGLDIQPLKWMSVSGEVFNFRSGQPPNLRGTLTIYPFFDPEADKPWNWIYIHGGVNNALNNERDFFVGGGIRFADREVKGLVGLLPVFSGN